MIKLLIIILPFYALPLLGQGQDLTGTWVGSSGMAFVKLVVIQNGDSLFGYTYDEGPGWCQATFEGEYQRSEKLLRGRGVQMLQHSGNHDLARYKLHYILRGGSDHLEGTVQLKLPPASIFKYGLPGPIFLRRENYEVDTIEFMRSNIEKRQFEVQNIPIVSEPVLAIGVDTLNRGVVLNPQVEVKKEKLQRHSKIVEHIYTNVDSVKITLYDNGEVDQDSVTLFFDEAIILNRSMISDKALELTITIPKDGKEHSLDLFAHNLGTIPPNTALVVITAGKKRYELRASYDLNTNARIVFTYSP